MSVAILVIPVTLQIISRYTDLIPAYIWTEEMARFLFIWMIMIGAMIGVRESAHFEVDVWPNLSPRCEGGSPHPAPGSASWRCRWSSWSAASSSRVSPGTHVRAWPDLPLWLIHIAWPVAGVTWIVFLGEQFVDEARVLLGRDAP
jgi:TRAP-type C4-dicarboxylate transport system permease small subunit